MHNILGKRVLAFSDCVVTAVSVQTAFVRSEGFFDTFGAEIVDMALSQVRCIWDGYFLRGGIDIGYWYYEKGLLVSPALVAAYKEERGRAIYPVISISKQLYKINCCETIPAANSTAKTPTRSQMNSAHLPIQMEGACISSTICVWRQNP